MTDTKHGSYEYEDPHSMKKAGQTGGGGGWLRDQYKRLYDPDAGDLHTSAVLIPDKPSQPETSDNSDLELYEWPKHLSALNKQFEVLNTKDIKLLSPKDQEDFSERFKSAYTKVKEAFASYISEAPNDLAKKNPTEAADNQLTQNLTNATNKLNEALEGLESLKQEAMKMIEKKLGERLRNIKDDYEKASKKAYYLGHEEGANALVRTYWHLSSQFKAFIEKARENYGLSTYADCKPSLDKMEATFKFQLDKMDDILYEKVLERHPVQRNTVLQAMKPIIENADFVHNMLKTTGDVYNRYHPERRKVRFMQVQKETMRRLLTFDYTNPEVSSQKPGADQPVNPEQEERHGKSSSAALSQNSEMIQMIQDREYDVQAIFQDLNQLASEVKDVKEYSEKVSEVETQVRTSLEYMKPIPAHRFDQKWIDTFQKKRRFALLQYAQGTDGRFYKELKQMASDILQVSECCKKVSEVETQIRTSLEYMKPILERLQPSKMPAHRFDQEWIDTFEDNLRSAWLKGLGGTNGPAFEELKQMASDIYKELKQMASEGILQASECCKKVSEVETQVLPSLASMESILASMESISEHLQPSKMPRFDQEWRDTFQGKLRSAWLEGLGGTNGPAFEELEQMASDVHQARECYKKVHEKVEQVHKKVGHIKAILKERNLNDILEKEFGETFYNEFQQKIDKTLRLGAQGINGQAFKDFDRLALYIHKMSNCCTATNTVAERVYKAMDYIKSTLEDLDLNDILEKEFGETFYNEFQQKIDKTMRLGGAQGIEGQAFKDFYQLHSNIIEMSIHFRTVDGIVDQLKKIPDAVEGHKLQQMQCNALLEAIQGRYDGPAFQVLEQSLEQQVQERFDPCQDKIVKMTYFYKFSQQFKVQYRHPCNIEVRNNHLLSSSRDEIDSFDDFERFKVMREEAPKKSGSDRALDNITIMSGLSQIEASRQKLEQFIEESIDTRFDASQSQVATIVKGTRNNSFYKSSFYKRLFNTGRLIKKYEKASDRFKEVKEDIRKIPPGDVRFQSNMLLGVLLCRIEELEDQIDIKMNK